MATKTVPLADAVEQVSEEVARNKTAVRRNVLKALRRGSASVEETRALIVDLGWIGLDPKDIPEMQRVFRLRSELDQADADLVVARAEADVAFTAHNAAVEAAKKAEAAQVDARGATMVADGKIRRAERRAEKITAEIAALESRFPILAEDRAEV